MVKNIKSKAEPQKQHFLRSQCKGNCLCHGNPRHLAAQAKTATRSNTKNASQAHKKVEKVQPKTLARSKKIQKKDKPSPKPVIKAQKKAPIKAEAKKNNSVNKVKNVVTRRKANQKPNVIAPQVPALTAQVPVLTAQVPAVTTNLFANQNVPAFDWNTNNFADDEIINNVQVVSGNQMIVETFDLDKKLTVEFKIDKKALQKTQDSSLVIPINVIIDVDSVEESNKSASDIIFVIDKSGSMSGSKMQQIKDTFKFVLDLLSEKDRVSIVVFDSYAKRITPLLNMTQKNKEATLAELKKVQASGGTCIVSGMKKALEVMKQRKFINDVTSILLLSDGQDSSSVPDTLKNEFNKLQDNQQFTLNTFGYGVDYDPKLMSSIANLKDGNFYFVERLHSLDECFIDCFGNLFSAVAEKCRLVINPESSEHLPNLEFKKAYGVEGTWQISNKTYITEWIHLISGKKKTFVLEMEIPKLDKEKFADINKVLLASCSFNVKGLRNSNNAIVDKRAVLQISLNQDGEQPETNNDNDQDVLYNHFRVKGAEILQEARKIADKNNFEDAKKILETFKDDIATSLKEHNNTQNLIKDLEEAIENVNPDNYETKGKHYLIQNYKAQMEERSTITGSNVQNRSTLQSNLVEKVLNKKKDDTELLDKL